MRQPATFAYMRFPLVAQGGDRQVSSWSEADSALPPHPGLRNMGRQWPIYSGKICRRKSARSFSEASGLSVLAWASLTSWRSGLSAVTGGEG